MHLWLMLSYTLGGSCSLSNTKIIFIWLYSYAIPLNLYMHTPAWESVRLWRGIAKKAEMTRQCLERCFQKETVKKLWMLYRFNLQIQVSYTCVANHHRSIILWSPIQFRVSRSPRAPQPYPNPGHSHHKACLPSSPEVCGCVCVLLCVCVYVCWGRLQTKLNTLAAGSC